MPVCPSRGNEPQQELDHCIEHRRVLLEELDSVDAVLEGLTEASALPSKYHNRRVTVDGVVFDSRAEARRYEQLRLMQRAGEIVDLQVHPRFPLVVNDVRICAYVADFSYGRRETYERVVEDVKGVRTAVYSLKRKLMLALYGIEIQEVAA